MTDASTTNTALPTDAHPAVAAALTTPLPGPANSTTQPGFLAGFDAGVSAAAARVERWAAGDFAAVEKSAMAAPVVAVTILVLGVAIGQLVFAIFGL